MQVVSLLSRDEACALRTRVDALPFVDGAATAMPSARSVKHNTQADASDPATQVLAAEVVERLTADHTVRQAAFPREFVNVMFNRFGPGDEYGLHIDAAILGKVGAAARTDLSFTLFLSDPDDYDGGELHIANGAASPKLKLPAGQLLLYSTQLLHEVRPVRRGVRVAVVGWIESWIPDLELREIITKLFTVQSKLAEEQLSPMLELLINEVAQRLLRYGAARG